MKKNLFLRFDIKDFFVAHKKQFALCVLSFFVGIVLGIIIGFSNENYLKLLNQDNKMLFSFINSSADIFGLFWKKFFILNVPLLLVFLFNLFYPISFLSFIFITYQSVIFAELNIAIIANYGFSGVINAIFLLIPANILYFFVIMVFLSVCLKRSKKAFIDKRCFSYFDDESFYLPMIFCFVSLLILDVIFYLIVPLFLKNFLIFIF